MYGLSDSLIEQIRAIAERHEVLKLVLFGSHARGNFRANSDIDLATYGLLPRNEMAFLSALDDLPTLLKIDTVVVRRDTDPAFLKEIEESGIVLLERHKEYAKQFSHALLKLQEAVVEAQTSPSTVIRDGVLHRFEIASEMAWRACHEALLADGYVGIDSPKATMRQAYTAGLIDDEATWLSLLDANSASRHAYDDESAKHIFQGIKNDYLPLFVKLKGSLSL